jgi:pimeloyl-ACP methyl ester carboxylesterase
MSAPDLEHHTLDCGAVVLHVVTAGPADAPPVVLLHGWPQTWQAWHALVPLLGGFRLVMPDLRGLGASGITDGGYDKTTVAGDVVTLVRDVLALDDVVLVGHDWGGVVAFHAAWQLESRVRGLAIVDVTIPNDLGAGVDINQGGGRWHHAFHRTTLAEELVVGREDAYYRWFYDTLAARPGRLDPRVVDSYVDAYRGLARTRAGFEYYRAMDADVAAAREVGAGGLTVPVLALGGDSSWGRGSEPAEVLRFFAADVTEGVVADCGHFVPEEQPAELARYLRAFLARL